MLSLEFCSRSWRVESALAGAVRFTTDVGWWGRTHSEFIPEVLDGVEFRARCRPDELIHTKLRKQFPEKAEVAQTGTDGVFTVTMNWSKIHTGGLFLGFYFSEHIPACTRIHYRYLVVFCFNQLPVILRLPTVLVQQSNCGKTRPLQESGSRL